MFLYGESKKRYIQFLRSYKKRRHSVKILTLAVNCNQLWYGKDFFSRVYVYMCFENIFGKKIDLTPQPYDIFYGWFKIFEEKVAKFERGELLALNQLYHTKGWSTRKILALTSSSGNF